MNGRPPSAELGGRAWRPHFLTLPAASRASLLGPVVTPETLHVVDSVDDLLLQVRQAMEQDLASARQECAAQLEQERKSALAQIDRERVAAMLALSMQQAALVEAMRPVLSQIALRAVRSVFNSIDPVDWYLQVMTSMDEAIRSEEHLQIVVAPTHKAAADRALQAWRQRSGRPVSGEVLVDEAIGASQLRLRNGGGTIDADLDEALAVIGRSIQAVTKALDISEAVQSLREHCGNSENSAASGGKVRADDRELNLSEVCDGT
jgi:flagellar biosynthesis/type III secretory pathway protein FliH